MKYHIDYNVFTFGVRRKGTNAMNNRDKKEKKKGLQQFGKLFGRKSIPAAAPPSETIDAVYSNRQSGVTDTTDKDAISDPEAQLHEAVAELAEEVETEVAETAEIQKPTDKKFLKSLLKKFKFPGFKTLDRYITRKFLGTYVFAIILIIVVVIVFDAVEKMDDFITTKATLQEVVFNYYLNFAPYFVNQFSGLFTFIAVIFFTSKMAYQTEIIAILSSGVSFKRLMWPYFVSAMLITALSLSLNLWIIPNANERRVDFERKHLTKNITLKYDKHIYRQIYPNTFAYIRSYNGKNEKAAFLAIEQYEGSRIVGSLDAANVKFNPETRRWIAEKYITRTFDEKNVEKMEKHNNLDTMINLDVVELGKLEDIIQTMSIGKLNTFISEQKDKGSDMVSMFEVERQNRFAYPVSTFVLTVIGLSLSSRKVRGGTGLHIGIGIALCFTYIMFCRFAAEFAKNGTFFSPILLVWLPNIIYAGIAIYLYRKAPK